MSYKSGAGKEKKQVIRKKANEGKTRNIKSTLEAEIRIFEIL